MGGQVRVFLNAKAGGAGVDAAAVIALFAAHGCQCVMTELNAELDLRSLARSEPIETAFIAAGGDGTVNCIAAVVAGTERRIGVIPVGTLNHFAKDLGLPSDLAGAVAVAAGSYTSRVDVGEVNGCIFVNNSSIGAYPLMVLDRERMKRTGWNRWASLVVASAKSFVRFGRLRIHLEVDGNAMRRKSPFLFVGNNEYCVDGMRIGKRDRLDSGELSLYLTHGVSRTGMLRIVLAALLGRVKAAPEYEQLKAAQFTVTLRKRHPRVALDGEVRRMTTPLRYRILPGALNVLCPAEDVA